MHLKRELGAFKLWIITVGMVISGQFFGWNYALHGATTIDLIISILIVSFFYLTFIFCCAELATTIPHAGGPYAFVKRAFGPFAGYMAGIAMLIEFGFGVPAIAVACGSYCHFLFPTFSAQWASTFLLLFFMITNLIGTKGIATIELIATLIALVGLTLFYIAGFHALHHLPARIDNTHFSLTKITMIIPFLVWLFLAVEGGSMTAEEMKTPEKHLSLGLCTGMLTLMLCSFLTVFITYNFTSTTQNPVDFPIAQVMESLYGFKSAITIIVAGLSLFGLIASLNGLIIGYSRQTFALARAGHLPACLAKLSKRHMPTYAILLPGIIGLICTMSANLANALVGLAVMGAMFMYCLTLISHIKLRVTDKNLHRPFKVWFPWVPIISLVLGLICLYCIVRYVILNEFLDIFQFKVPLCDLVLMILILAITGYFYKKWIPRSSRGMTMPT